MGYRHRKLVLWFVDANMNVADLPAVRWVNVIWACRRAADEICKSAHQHVVAWARPRFVGRDLQIGVEAGVEEEVDRRPAVARLDWELFEACVEVLRAADVAEVTHVLVVLLRASQGEAVVATDSVLNHLEQRIKVVIEVLAMEAGLRVSVAHQAARRRRVEPALKPLLQLRLVEGEKV